MPTKQRRKTASERKKATTKRPTQAELIKNLRRNMDIVRAAADRLRKRVDALEARVDAQFQDLCDLKDEVRRTTPWWRKYSR